ETGLCGNTRIQYLPALPTARLIAIRAASICRPVIQPGSSVCRPASPKATKLPRVALPLTTPRITLRYLVRLGSKAILRLLGLLHEPAVNPALDTGNSVRGLGFRKAIVDVCVQGAEWHRTKSLLLNAAEVSTAKTARNYNLAAVSATALDLVDLALDRTTEAAAALKLLRHLLGCELRIQLRLLDFHDADVHHLAVRKQPDFL